MLWDPFLISDLFQVRGGRRAHRHPLVRPRPRPAGRRGPAINLHASEDEARVRVLVPGLSAEDLALSIEGNVLTIAGEFRRANEGAEVASPRRERFTGRFTRAIRLPFPVDGDRIEASLERGVLDVTLPRAAEDHVRRIEVTNR